MTETEWLACDDALKMLEYLRGKMTPRKLRLFACAWGFDLWPRMTDERSRSALATAVLFADGLVGLEELRAATAEAREAQRKANTWATSAAWCASWEGFSESMALTLADSYMKGSSRRDGYVEDRLRCLFGNPFRPTLVRHSWLAWEAGLVAKLGESAYESSLDGGRLDPQCLAVLSDALEEAGCTDEAVLTHLRSHGPHVRGCWALDLILGKE